MGQSASAFPSLAARGCDSIFCLPSPSPSELDDAASGIGGALDDFWNLFRSPDPPESTAPGVVEGAQGDAASSSAPSADIEIHVVATPTAGMNQKECGPTPAPALTPESGTDSDPVSPLIRSALIRCLTWLIVSYRYISMRPRVR